jgi:tRNA-2-methylthio-N6-dimethylallyladenosine synthase
MKFHIITFGCQMNVCDSDWLSYYLQTLGWEPVAEPEAECFIVNTCSVREKPEQKVYSLLGRLKEYWDANPRCFVAVGGCVAQQVGTGFWKRFPFVRLVFGTDGVANVPAALQQIAGDPDTRISLLDFLDHYPERENRFPSFLPAQAFVNIMQGCDNFCAYCIVPYTRGRQKSRASNLVVEECRALVERGVREISLLGQNVNSYGLDSHGDGVSFAQLLNRVAAIPGLERLRFTTSHPKDIAPEVIEAFGVLSNLCPQLHLPVQTGSDVLLKSMGRKYTRERYEKIVSELRSVCPDIALTTDLIVGFPGETDRDFEETLDLMRLVRYESSFSFKYSDRPGVRAERMPNKIPEELKQERLQRLQSLQAEHTIVSLENRVGKPDQVLVEGMSRKPQDAATPSWRGRDLGGRIVNFNYDTRDLVGKIVPVTITEAKKHSLWGEVSGSPW